jgi:RNA polymerase sigma-70 factor (ECF subfamily)
VIEDGVRGLVDHLFRHEAGRMVAALARVLGPSRLDLCEEAVQDALLRALRVWPYRGVPDRPGAWLQRVALNAALDRLRRDTTARDKRQVLEREILSTRDGRPSGARFTAEVSDDQLRLVFLCCHPRLPLNAQVALTLKLVAGFSAAEIARAFLVGEATIAQRLVRAKRRLREEPVALELPVGEELVPRLDAVREVLYLMFSAGYAAHLGEDLVRADLCAEAIRLGEALVECRSTVEPAIHALLALMHFQASRLPARTDQRGNLVILAEQDRERWDRTLIARGFQHLGRSASGTRLTTYHVEAAIASCHAVAVDGGEPDWRRILELYDQLYALNPSAVVALNRAVAVARARGCREALELLERFADEPALASYHLLPATRGQLLLEDGRAAEAVQSFATALERPCSAPERRFLASRLAAARAAEGTA